MWVAYGTQELTLQVDDDGQAKPGVPVAPGTGLTRMRERVTALGGELSAGPRPSDGFSVLATIPVAVKNADTTNQPALSRPTCSATGDPAHSFPCNFSPRVSAAPHVPSR